MKKTNDLINQRYVEFLLILLKAEPDEPKTLPVVQAKKTEAAKLAAQRVRA